MARPLALACVGMLALFSSAVRAACDDIQQHINIPSPMTGDMVVDLDTVSIIECEELSNNSGRTALEEVVISGGTLTLQSVNTVRFVNVGFTVMPGAKLVFDMPETELGPNAEGFHRESYTTFVVEIQENATAIFKGTVVGKEVRNAYAFFKNAGTLKFKKSVTFEDNGNILRENTGVVKFKGDASFKNSKYLVIENDGGSVRFKGKSSFENSAFNFDGAWGCSVSNKEVDGSIIFKGDATFSNDDCGEGVSLYNKGKMRFKSNAYFHDNKHHLNGGAVNNLLGSMIFKGDAQFINNSAALYGGGIAVTGGVVTFKDSVTFDGNKADSGGAFAALGGKLKFKNPSALTFGDNTTEDDRYSDDENCTIGEVSDEGKVQGFPLDDVCASASQD